MANKPVRTRLVFAACLALVAIMAALPAWALPTDSEMLKPFPHPKGYVCYRAPSPITIDGSLADPAWEAAPWTDDFGDIEGDKRPKPPLRTRVKMLYDDEALYIGAELEEPHIWAKLKAHDSVIFEDNDFEVFLNPNGDNHLYGELELNALNTTWDLLLTKPYKDGGKAITAWEITGLKTAVRVNGTINDAQDKDTSWTVEIRWPWDGLKELIGKSEQSKDEVPIPPRNNDKWRINFSRVEWDTKIVDGQYTKLPGKPEHNWVWSPQGVIDMHRPERWGYVQFSTAKPGSTAFQPDPDWEIRDLLHRAYYAERLHFKTNGKYTASIPELGLKPVAPLPLTLEPCRSGFEASVTVPVTKDKKARRLSINQDARIWVE